MPKILERKKAFSIYEFLKKRPLSYSALNSFSDPEWGDPEKWYQSYIKGIRQTSKYLTFGDMVDKKFQADPTFLPTIPRYSKLQHRMEAILLLGKQKIPLLGIADNLKDTTRFAIRDLKTGKQGKYQWTQKKADETEQLTYYALLRYLIEKIRPEDIDFYIDWVPTYEPNALTVDFVQPIVPVTFKTKRTMADVLKLHKKIEVTIKAMEAYVRSKEE